MTIRMMGGNLHDSRERSTNVNNIHMSYTALGFPGGSARTESTCNARDLGSIPGKGNAYPLQYSGLDNFMDCIVHWVAKSQKRLSDFHCTQNLLKRKF